jgi:hypothetical protein
MNVPLVHSCCGSNFSQIFLILTSLRTSTTVVLHKQIYIINTHIMVPSDKSTPTHYFALTAFFFPAAPLKPAFNKSSNPASAFLTFFGGMGPLDVGCDAAAAALACLAAILACRAAASFSFRFNGSPPCTEV